MLLVSLVGVAMVAYAWVCFVVDVADYIIHNLT